MVRRSITSASTPLGRERGGPFERAVHHLPRRRDGEIAPRPRDARQPERHVVLALGHRTAAGEQPLRLQHQHRIARPQRGFHQALRVGGRGGHADDQPGNVRPDRMVAAGMVRAGAAHRAAAHADHHRRVHLSVRHVAQLRRLQRDLPARLEQEIGKHQVGDDAHAGGGGAQGGAGKALLADRACPPRDRRRIPDRAPSCGRTFLHVRRCPHQSTEYCGSPASPRRCRRAPHRATRFPAPCPATARPALPPGSADRRRCAETPSPDRARPTRARTPRSPARRRRCAHRSRQAGRRWRCRNPRPAGGGTY